MNEQKNNNCLTCHWLLGRTNAICLLHLKCVLSTDLSCKEYKENFLFSPVLISEFKMQKEKVI